MFLYKFDLNSASVLLLSCALAASINLSTFVFLGRMLATTFNLTGHLKTVLIVLGGWMVFGEKLLTVQWLGVGLAIAGVAAYSYAGQQKQQSQKRMAAVAQPPEEKQAADNGRV